MNKYNYEIYGNSRNYRNNNYVYTDKNNDAKLRENIKVIHSNITIIKKNDFSNYDKEKFENLCQETISYITETNNLVSKIQTDNKNEILNFLSKSSQICKNSLWYRQMKDYSKKIKSIDEQKKEVLESNNKIIHNIDNVHKIIENHVQDNNEIVIKNIENKIDEKRQQEIETLQNILQEINNLTTIVNQQNDVCNNLENKINCCMKSLACSLDLLSYNINKSREIQDDLQKNNIITAKISMDSDKFNQKLLEFREINSEINYNDTDTDSDNDSEDINEIKNLLFEANKKKKIPENGLTHYLLNKILKNSKDILSQIIPQMNMWQRQKIFTSVMKLVEERIDGCSEKLKEVVNKKTFKNDQNDQDIVSMVHNIFSTDSLKITKEDIKNAAWEGSDSESESDSDSESDHESFSMEKNMKKTKSEILDDIMKELNTKKNIKIKKKKNF